MCLKESSATPMLSVGRAGEVGILQVTPPAMQTTGVFISPDSTFLEQALAGASFLRWLYDHNGHDWEKAVMAYNVGPDLEPYDKAQAYLAAVQAFLTA
jgi:hypothetical protein